MDIIRLEGSVMRDAQILCLSTDTNLVEDNGYLDQALVSYTRVNRT